MNTPSESLKFKVLKRKGRLFLDHHGWTYDLSPPEFVRMILPPNVAGVDAFLVEGSKRKGISGDFTLEFSSDFNFECDASATYSTKFMDGWIYDISSGSESRKAWVCSYMKLIFKEPPDIIYLSIEALQDRTHPQP